MKTLKATVLLGGVVTAALVGLAGPASASTPIAHHPCDPSERMHKAWDVNNGQPIICVSTGVTGSQWVPDATPR
ncbi:hypothetical protein JK358_05025 [Nocardia sp. 2]|uniref:Secreted protein n=1 Tax=Nocardia acididurans TaxID=2802282 RepID=A0ABS1M1Q0_9NOCA|nr:hypothetical protein [Nocardia acididurans]MBL1073749.1 hypothetical protein [Nocardia acididurans]